MTSTYQYNIGQFVGRLSLRYTHTQSITAGLGFILKIAFKYPVVEIFMQYLVYNKKASIR